VHPAPGQTANISTASTLLVAAGQHPSELLADKGRDSDELRADLYLQGSHPIIPWKSNRKQPGTLDPARHARRYRIERMMVARLQAGVFSGSCTVSDVTRMLEGNAHFSGCLPSLMGCSIVRWLRYVRTRGMSFKNVLPLNLLM
jgi:hypothetical protein